jgi:guanosine-3',5'-bis(diphosphate) 3'-pyrophosphohydrolase
MMRQYELVERVKRYNPNADEALLDRAYVYAMLAHGTQKRASGDPYSPIRSKWRRSSPTCKPRRRDHRRRRAARHDRGHRRHPEEIDEKFGSAIGELVDGLTKLKKLDLVSKQAAQAENLRKLLLAIASDVRVCWSSSPTACTTCARCTTCRRRSATASPRRRWTSTPRSPGRMGMQEMREELEDLAFRQINAEAYEAMITAPRRDLARQPPRHRGDRAQLARKLAREGIAPR